MDRQTLNNAVDACKQETRQVLQLIYDELNQGQRKKILKNELIKAKFDKFGVETE